MSARRSWSARALARLSFTCLLMLSLRQASPAVAANGPEACRSKEAVTIAFVGDLIFQDKLQREAMAPGSSYGKFWSTAEPLFRAVDAVYGNVEGTLASTVTHQGDTVADPGRDATSAVYATPAARLNFNYHASLATDLKASNFRIVSTGNNHALDRGSAGIDQTIDGLASQGIVAVGTRHSSASQSGDWQRTTRIAGLNIGWVACTYGTNGHPDPHNQVLNCDDERDDVIAAITSLDARPDIDAIFFVPHWGIENHTVIARRQTALARDVIEAGANAVVGTHPHVLQQWDWLTSASGRKAPVIYSTGNFISAQPLDTQRHGMIVLITLHKPIPGAKAELNSARYVLTEFTPETGKMSVVPFDPAHHAALPPQLNLTENDATAMLRRCD